MAGQQANAFASTPAYETPKVDGAAREVTELYRPVAAQVQGTGQQLSQLGNVFGSFFGNLARTSDAIGQTLHQEKLNEVHKENAALKELAMSDVQKGVARRPEYENRQAYFGMYQEASADRASTQDVTKMSDEMAKGYMLDGSTGTPREWADNWIKNNLGEGGTGDPTYDARYLYSINKAADGLVARYGEKTQQNIETIATQDITGDLMDQMQAGSLTQGSLALGISKATTIFNGDRVAADKFVLNLAAQVTNATQGTALWERLHDLGYDKTHPELMNDIGERLVARTQQVKTMAAREAVNNWNLRVAGLAANPAATSKDWADAIYDYQKIDSIHGVGMAGVGQALHGMQQAAKATAGVNLARYAVDNQVDHTLVGDHFGVSAADVANEHQAKMLSEDAQRGGGALGQTTDNLGNVHPTKTPEAMQEFVAYQTSDRIQRVLPAPPPYIKSEMSNALLGKDSALAVNAYSGIKAIQGKVGDAGLSHYLTPQAEARWRALDAAAPMYGDPTAAFKYVTDNPKAEDTLSKAQQGGKVEWSSLLGREKKAFEVENDLMSAVGKEVLEKTGRDGFIRNPKVGFHPDVQAEIMGIAAIQAAELKAQGITDPDRVYEATAKILAGRYVTVPGKDGNFQLAKNPNGSRGAALSDPLNAAPDHPFSVQKGYKPFYAGTAFKNALGEVEDPVDHWKADTKKFKESFPGIAPDVGELYLDATQRNGLRAVYGSDQTPLMFRPGMSVAVPTTVEHPYESAVVGLGGKIVEKTTKPVKVPDDPAKAAEFFKQYLPPGMYAMYDSRSNTYGVMYGYRIEGTQAAADARRASNEKRREVEGQPEHQAVGVLRRPLR